MNLLAWRDREMRRLLTDRGMTPPPGRGYDRGMSLTGTDPQDAPMADYGDDIADDQILTLVVDSGPSCRCRQTSVGSDPHEDCEAHEDDRQCQGAVWTTGPMNPPEQCARHEGHTGRCEA